MGKTIKHNIGLFFIGLGFISPLLTFAVPFLGFTKVVSNSLVGLLIFGIPEICTLAGIALIGKEGFNKIIGKIRILLGLPEIPSPASKTQYNIALLLIILCITIQLLVAYIPAITYFKLIEEHKLLINIGADITFLISIFFIGGQQMIDKLKKLFTWEKID